MARADAQDAFEKALAAAWARELALQLKTAVAQIRATLPFDSVVTWVTAQVRGAKFTEVILEEIFVTVAAEVGTSLGQEIFVGEIIGDRGAAWASEYSFRLVKDINATTLTKLRRIVPRSLQEGLSIDDITKKLTGTFGRSRAQMIAVTETTRATVEGQREFISELNKIGVFTDTFWLTARDSRVDDRICRPLDGVLRIDGVYQHPTLGTYNGPPAHVNCRCTENDKLIEEVPA